MSKPNVFQLIDLDRTLFDTSKFVKAVTDEINKTDPGYGTELDEKFEAAYKKEETFFLLRELRASRGNDWFEALVGQVLAEYGAEAFALEGVAERLAYAETLGSKPGWGILTYGDEIDQRMKLAIMGLEDAPMYIASTPEKSEVLRLWQMSDGRFQLPFELGGNVYDEVTLEDDKLRAFHHLPEHATGFWITSANDAEETVTTLRNSGGAPGEIHVVSGLPEIIQALTAQYPEDE